MTTAPAADTIFVERTAHWGGDVDRYTGRIVVEVDREPEAADLAPIGLVLEARNPEMLSRLADAARRILAEEAAEQEAAP